MLKLKIKFKFFLGVLLVAAWLMAAPGSTRAATMIYSPVNNSTYNTGTAVNFYWYYTSPYNYISIWNGSWSAWNYLGNQTRYLNQTRTSPGWLGAQVLTWENNRWQYSNVVWVYFQSPPPPPPPPIVAPVVPTLNSNPVSSVYQGESVLFSWNSVARATGYYIIYRRDGVWDGSWIYNGLTTNRSFNTTGLNSSIAAQVAACNTSGCGYSGVVNLSILPRAPGQMNLTPLTSGSNYSGSFGGAGLVNYSRVNNTMPTAQLYSIRLTNDTAQTAVSLVDSNGNPATNEMISLSSGYVIFKIQPLSTRYVSFRGQRAGVYNYEFNRFRNFPFFEGQ